MKKHYLFIFSLLFIFNLQAQVLFEKTYGTIDNDGGYSIHICSNNSYIITGYTSDFYTGYEDIYLIKINEYGDTLWTRTEGDAYSFEWGFSVIEDNDNAYIVSGYMYLDNGRTPFLLKYDENGQKLWLKDYQDYIYNATARDIIVTSDNNYVFGGIKSNSKFSEGKSWEDEGYLMKTNQDGDFIWKHYYGGGAKSASNHIETSDQGFVLCGTDDDIYGYDQNAWIVKAHEDGGLAWDNSFGQEYYSEYAHSIKQTEDGGYIICGNRYYGETCTLCQLFITKTNEIGEEEWTKIFDYGEEIEVRSGDIEISPDGGYFICGTKQDYLGADNNILLIKTDIAGDTLWTRQYGGAYEERVHDMQITGDGGVIMCGTTRSYGMGGKDIYVIKTDADGLITNTQNPNMPNLEFQITPNPSKGLFQIHSDLKIKGYKVYNINGTMVQSKDFFNIEKKSIDINLYQQKSGIYYLAIQIRDKFQIMKLVKL